MIDTNGLTHYDVVYIEKGDLEGTKQVFRCWAEDADHAIEQAKDEQTVGIIVLVNFAGQMGY